MKKYKHAKEKKSYERVSFYIALSICMMAVGLAVWAAYSTFGTEDNASSDSYFSSLSTDSAAVAQPMTGVSATEQPRTEKPVQTTQPQTEQSAQKEHSFTFSETKPQSTKSTEKLDPMKAVLKVEESLVYPVRSHQVLRSYSENSVYNATMHDYRAHTGCDFAAGEGESVYAMCGGTVSNISISELYGGMIEVDCGEFCVYYCGLDSDFMVKNGDELTTGDTVGLVGRIPLEADEPSHIHIEVRVGDTLIDPLSVINSDN